MNGKLEQWKVNLDERRRRCVFEKFDLKQYYCFCATKMLEIVRKNLSLFKGSSESYHNFRGNIPKFLETLRKVEKSKRKAISFDL